VAYPAPDGAWRDHRGLIIVLPERDVTMVTDAGEIVAALIHSSPARIDRASVTGAVSAARLLLDTERIEAGALARVNDLRAPRQRKGRTAFGARRWQVRILADRVICRGPRYAIQTTRRCPDAIRAARSPAAITHGGAASRNGHDTIGNVTADHAQAMVFAEGTTVVRRDVLRGKVWSAAPYRVIRDTGTTLMLACWPGVEMLAPATWIRWLRTGDDAPDQDEKAHCACSSELRAKHDHLCAREGLYPYPNARCPVNSQSGSGHEQCDPSIPALLLRLRPQPSKTYPRRRPGVTWSARPTSIIFRPGMTVVRSRSQLRFGQLSPGFGPWLLASRDEASQLPADISQLPRGHIIASGRRQFTTLAL
jgi:hypothetical protein